MKEGNMELVGSNSRLKRPQKKHPLRELSRWQQITLVAAVALLIAGAIWYARIAVPVLPQPDRYQAVFLDNGQVYFGKLKSTSGDYLKLESAYYSKSQDLPEDATAEQRAAVSSNVALVKVGDEVYGPENSLNIRADQVLFWQDLSADSKVAEAIQDQQ